MDNTKTVILKIILSIILFIIALMSFHLLNPINYTELKNEFNRKYDNSDIIKIDIHRSSKKTLPIFIELKSNSLYKIPEKEETFLQIKNEYFPNYEHEIYYNYRIFKLRIKNNEMNNLKEKVEEIYENKVFEFIIKETGSWPIQSYENAQNTATDEYFIKLVISTPISENLNKIILNMMIKYLDEKGFEILEIINDKQY